MATQKHAKHNSSSRTANQPSAKQNAAPQAPAVGPTISVIASPLRDPAAGTRSPASPADERAAMTQRRNLIIAGMSLLALLIAFLAYRSLTSEAPTVATPAVAPTAAVAQPAVAAPIAAPTAQPAAVAAPIAAPATAPTAAAAEPIAAPAVLPTAVAVIVAPAILPTAAAVVAAPAVPSAAPAAAITCPTIAGLPLFAGATCTEQKSDQDDGVTKLKNTYAASATADEIRRFYENTFTSNGWTLGDFKYDLNVGQRRAAIDVDTDQGPTGMVTTIKLTEYLAAASTGTTCAPIAGLPTVPNATCVKFDVDQDDGVFKAEHSYTTTASPEDVRRFYATALAQNGWTGPDFQYDVQQGLRRMQVDVETKLGAQGSFTELRIAEK